MIPPLYNKEKVPKILFEKMLRMHELAVTEQYPNKTGVLSHLTNLFEAYQYVYYVIVVDHYLHGRKGKIVDWGGFMGQVTVLLRSIGYNCENNVLSYPSKKEIFAEFDIPYKLNRKNPKKLPYEDNSVLAIISSGVLEHVYEHG